MDAARPFRVDVFQKTIEELIDAAEVAGGLRRLGRLGGRKLLRLGSETKTGAVGCMVRPARAYAGGGE